MPDQLTLAEKRARLEELCEDLRRLATMPPLQRIGNVGMRIVIGEQWILDLALETLARREREERRRALAAEERISELESQLAAQHERVIMLEVSYAEKLEALSDANEMLAELESQLAVEKETWRCFHCGFETSDRKEASGHFGEFGEEYPLCIHWSDLDADGKASEFLSINAELEGEREENLKLRQQVEQLEYLTGSQEADISSRFKGCRTINEAFFKYDSMEGRALAAEERIAELEAQLAVYEKGIFPAITKLLDDAGVPTEADGMMLRPEERVGYGWDERDRPAVPDLWWVRVLRDSRACRKLEKVRP